MLGSLIFLFFAKSALAAELDYAAGAEVIGHLQRQVNPDFAEGVAEYALFAKLRYFPLVAELEFGFEPGRSSDSGNLSITTNSYDIALWAHYEFLPPGEWSPYVGAGVGEFFDQVNTTFAGSKTVSNGHRLKGGLAVGISRSFSWALLEIEGRGELVEESTKPDLSALVRFGVLF